MADEDKANESSPRPIHPWPFSVIEAEWPRVKQMPYTAVLIAFVSAFICVSATAALYHTFIIENKNTEIDSLNTRIHDLETAPKQTGTVTDSEDYKKLKADFENLKAHAIVDEGFDEWPALTSQQSEEIAAALRQGKVSSLAVYLSGSSTEKLGRSVYAAALTQLDTSHLYMSESYQAKGITLEMEKGDPVGTALLKALQDVYPKTDVQVRDGYDPSRGSELDIWIGGSH